MSYWEQGRWGRPVEVNVGIPWDDCAGDFVAAVCFPGGLAFGLCFGSLGRWGGGHGGLVESEQWVYREGDGDSVMLPMDCVSYLVL